MQLAGQLRSQGLTKSATTGRGFMPMGAAEQLLLRCIDALLATSSFEVIIAANGDRADFVGP